MSNTGLLRALLLMAGLLLSCVTARADSVDPDLKRLIREAQKPKVDLGPSRVGWNGPEIPVAPPVNPTYESLRLDSPAALRQELKQVLVPQWQVLLAFVILIAGLRLLLASRPAEQLPANVVPFPVAPRQEAA
jgi:hypothetical protein